MMPAVVQSGSLGLDFGSKTFATSLNLSSQGVGIQTFTQSGTINPSTGIFLSNSINSGNTANGSVAGAVTLDARQAGFVFKAPIGPGSFTGATLWGR
jgi:hypothetical protein